MKILPDSLLTTTKPPCFLQCNHQLESFTVTPMMGLHRVKSDFTSEFLIIKHLKENLSLTYLLSVN